MAANICPVTGQECDYRRAVQEIDLDYSASKKNLQAELDRLRELKMEHILEQAEQFCGEECGIAVLGTVVALRHEAALEARDTLREEHKGRKRLF